MQVWRMCKALSAMEVFLLVFFSNKFQNKRYWKFNTIVYKVFKVFL